MEKVKYAELHPISMGLTLGIVWGLALLVMALITQAAGGYGASFVQGVGALYTGYNATLVGGLIGALWGFLDAFVGGAVVAWLYNFFCARFTKAGDFVPPEDLE